MFKVDPGPCPVCDAPHHTCTATPGGAPIVAGNIMQATSVAVTREADGHVRMQILEAERVQRTLPANQTTTGTYRGSKKRGAPTK